MRSFILPKNFQVTLQLNANSEVTFGRFTITSSESTVALKMDGQRELLAPIGGNISVKVASNRAYLGVDGKWKDSTYLNESSLNYTHVTLEGEGVVSFEVIDLAGMPEHQIAGVISADTVDPVAEFDFLQRFKTPIGLVTDATFDGGLKVLPSNTVTTMPANLHSDFCLVFDFNRGGDFVVFEQGQLKVEVTSGSVMLTVEETEISVPFILLPSNRIAVDRFGTSITLQCNHDTASVEHSSPITSERPSIFQGYSGTVEAVAYASHSVLKGATCSQKKVKNRRNESASVTVDRLQPGWSRTDGSWQLDFVDGEFINLAFEVFADNTQIANLLKAEGGKVIAFGVDVGGKGVCFLSLLPTGNRVTIFREGVELGEVDLTEVKLTGLEGDYTLFSACSHVRQVWPSLQYHNVKPAICGATSNSGSTVSAVSMVDELGRMFSGSVEVITLGPEQFVKIAEVVSGESRLFLDCLRADVLATGQGENSLPLGASFTSDKFLLKYGAKTFNIPAVEDEDNLEGRLTETTPKVRTTGRVLCDLVSVLSDTTSNEEAALKGSLFAGEHEDQPFPTDVQTVSVFAKIEPVGSLTEYDTIDEIVPQLPHSIIGTTHLLGHVKTGYNEVNAEITAKPGTRVGGDAGFIVTIEGSSISLIGERVMYDNIRFPQFEATTKIMDDKWSAMSVQLTSVPLLPSYGSPDITSTVTYSEDLYGRVLTLAEAAGLSFYDQGKLSVSGVRRVARSTYGADHSTLRTITYLPSRTNATSRVDRNISASRLSYNRYPDPATSFPGVSWRPRLESAEIDVEEFYLTAYSGMVERGELTSTPMLNR